MTGYSSDLVSRLVHRQRRYYRREKDEFLRFVESELENFGLKHRRTSISGLQKHVHLEAGSDDPEFILLAHYDTQTMIPFWVEWLVRAVGHTRTVLFLVVFYLLSYGYSLLGDTTVSRIVEFIFYVSLIAFVVPNRRTMNDNTSGVIALLLMAERMSTDRSLMENVKIVFTDNEERLLTGSFALRRRWKKDGFDYSRRRIISVDCVGRGNVPVITYNFNSSLAKDLLGSFKATLPGTKIINMWFTPFSDAYNFALSGAVNVNMMERSIIPGGFFIRNIHSPMDRDISLENIGRVVGAIGDYCSTAGTSRDRV